MVAISAEIEPRPDFLLPNRMLMLLGSMDSDRLQQALIGVAGNRQEGVIMPPAFWSTLGELGVQNAAEPGVQEGKFFAGLHDAVGAAAHRSPDILNPRWSYDRSDNGVSTHADFGITK